MQHFHCRNCQQLVFFENSICVSCGHSLAFLPDLVEMGSFVVKKPGVYEWAGSKKSESRYRPCINYEKNNTCNWAVRGDDPNPYCCSCQLTRTIPDLSHARAL